MIVAGIGCRRACPPDDIVGLVTRAAAEAGLPIDSLAAPIDKCDNLREAAARLGLPIIEVTAEDLLQAQARCITRSPRVLAAVGVASVAEAAALAAVGPDGYLIAPRIATLMATCAVASSRKEGLLF